MKQLQTCAVALCAIFSICLAEPTQEWTKFQDGKYIMKIFETASWADAYRACKDAGYELLTIESAEEATTVLDILGEFITDRLWLGGTDLGSELKFYWATTGAPFNYTDWHVGEPTGNNPTNGIKEDCVQLWRNKSGIIKWNDSPCENVYGYTCEYYDPCARRPF